MTDDRPTVSVVLAVYNAAWCIERALDSAVAQTRTVDEIIVCDDGSTDGTADLVERKYGARVRVLRLPHANAAAARVAGLSEARSRWLAFLDADDWWENDKIERQLAFLEAHPEVRWLTSDGAYVSDEGVLRDSWMAGYFEPVRELVGDLFPALVRRCFPLMSSMMVDRDAYRAVGGMDRTIVYSHDYDLWLRLGARFPGAVMTDKLVKYWWHPNQLSRRVESRYRDDLMLLERVAAGKLREDRAVIDLARLRVAAHRFDLGLWALRAGRHAEARQFMLGALGAGPPHRRLFALAAALLPAPVVPFVMRMTWAKSVAQRARAPVGTIPGGGEFPR